MIFKKLTKLFPPPPFFQFKSAGVDFSDATLRFMTLSETVHGFVPEKYGAVAIPEGCMQGGRIIDAQRLTNFLSEVRKKHKLKYVHVAIPESQTYSFTLTLDNEVVADIRGAIELVLEDNIPLKVLESVFDYDILAQSEKEIIVQVVAMSTTVSEAFFQVFANAGMVPLSFELDGQAVARAVFTPGDTKSYMVVDFGAHRTSITIVTAGSTVYTSTIDFGGSVLIDALVKELKVTPEEAQKMKREQGLVASGEHKAIFSTLVGGISILKDEINRRYVYWHEKRAGKPNFPPIETIYLCGGHSNLRGLAEYLKVTLKLNVVQVNPWKNCFSFEEIVPDISYETSMSYVTTIGLALTQYIHE